MTSTIKAVNITCRQHYPLGEFWAAVLGWGPHPDEPNLPDDPVTVLVGDPISFELLLQPEEEGVAHAGRIHVDIAPVDRTREEYADKCVVLYMCSRLSAWNSSTRS